MHNPIYIDVPSLLHSRFISNHLSSVSHLCYCLCSLTATHLSLHRPAPLSIFVLIYSRCSCPTAVSTLTSMSLRTVRVGLQKKTHFYWKWRIWFGNSVDFHRLGLWRARFLFLARGLHCVPVTTPNLNHNPWLQGCAAGRVARQKRAAHAHREDERETETKKTNNAKGFKQIEILLPIWMTNSWNCPCPCPWPRLKTSCFKWLSKK